MKNIIKNILLKKHRGSSISFVVALLFIVILIVWALFTFRLTMLNTVFEYLDDCLTSSTLGGALVNVDEYGRSDQLIIHETDEYIASPTTDQLNLLNSSTGAKYDTQGWTRREAAILLSELNYGSDIMMYPASLNYKQILDFKKRANKSPYDSEKLDEYLRKSISAFIGNFTYNISNGHEEAEYTAENNIASLNSLNGSDGKTMLFPHELFKDRLLGNNIISDIEVTRMDIYNVYRTDTAELHTYQSDYFVITYDSSGPHYEWTGAKSGGKTAEDGKITGARSGYESGHVTYTTPAPEYSSSNISAFEELAVYCSDGSTVRNKPLIDDPDYAARIAQYNARLTRWTWDGKYFNEIKANPANAVCFVDTKSTFQGEYDKTRPKRYKYEYFFSENGDTTITSTSQADRCIDKSTGQYAKAPISGYSVFSYKSSTPGYEDGEIAYVYAPGITYSYNDTRGTTIDDKTTEICIQGGKMANAYIEDTSIYVEITFTVETFPSAFEGFQFGDYNSQRVTVARLIDIELLDNGDDDTFG